MSFLDIIGVCNYAGRTKECGGYLGSFANLERVMAKYPSPRLGMSFNNLETRSVWLHDGVRWVNTTQANPFTMIKIPSEAGSVRSGRASTFYYIPTEVGVVEFCFSIDNDAHEWNELVTIEHVSDMVFIEWDGSQFHIAIHKVDVNIEGQDAIEKALKRSQILPITEVITADVEVSPISYKGILTDVVYLPTQKVFAGRLNNTYYNNWGTSDGSHFTDAGYYNEIVDGVYQARKDVLVVDRKGSIYRYDDSGVFVGVQDLEGMVSREEYEMSLSNIAVGFEAFTQGVNNALFESGVRLNKVEKEALMLNRVLPFSGIVTGTVELELSSQQGVQYDIVYLDDRDVFAVRKNGKYYENWVNAGHTDKSYYNENGHARRDVLLVDKAGALWKFANDELVMVQQLDGLVSRAEYDIVVAELREQDIYFDEVIEELKREIAELKGE